MVRFRTIGHWRSHFFTVFLIHFMHYLFVFGFLITPSNATATALQQHGLLEQCVTLIVLNKRKHFHHRKKSRKKSHSVFQLAQMELLEALSMKRNIAHAASVH